MTPKALIQRMFHGLGGVALVRLRHSAHNRILTYHNFDSSDVASFGEQCEHIRRHYHPVTLDELADFIRDGRTLPRNSVAVTVDDGYRDFFLHAYPTLRRCGIPATMFLMTGFLDRKIELWWEQVRYAFINSPLNEATLRLGENAPESFPLAGAVQRQAASSRIEEMLKDVPNRVRVAFMDRLPEVLQVVIPVPLPHEPVSWNEVREMSSNGITFGAHTQSHPILSSLETEEEIRCEVFGSRDRITEELGKPPSHFCFPNGRTRDIDERVVRIVEAAGFRTALSTERGFNQHGSNPYLLRRLSMEPDLPGLYFTQQIAGFRL